MKRFLICLLLLVIAVTGIASAFSSNVTGREKLWQSEMVYGGFSSAGTTEGTITLAYPILTAWANASSEASGIMVRWSGKSLYIKGSSEANAINGHFITICK